MAALRYGNEVLQAYYGAIQDEEESPSPGHYNLIVLHPVALPDELWVDLLDGTKDEFEVDGAVAVFSTWRVQVEDPLMREEAIIADARMTDERAARLLDNISEGEFNLRLKFLRGRDQGDWFIEDKIEPIREEVGRGQGIVTITRENQPGALTGIDWGYYQNTYPITVTVYGLYLIRVPDPANLAPMRVGRLNCVAQRVTEHFEGTQRGHGLTDIRRRRYKSGRPESMNPDPQLTMLPF